MYSRDEIIGFLNLTSKTIGAFSEREMDVAVRIADQVGGAVANAELHKAAERDAQEREVLAEIGRVISLSLDIDQVYEQFATQVGKIIPFDRIAVTFLRQDEGTLNIAYTSGLDVPGWDPTAPIPIEGSIDEQILKTKRGVTFGTKDIQNVVGEFPGLSSMVESGVRAKLAAPVTVRGEVIGVLSFDSLTIDSYTERHLALAERVANQIAGAIANAELHKSLERESRERGVLAEIGRIISSSLDISQIYEAFADQVRKIIPFKRIAISLVGGETGSITVAYRTGMEIPGWAEQPSRPLAGTIDEQVLQTRVGVIFGPEDIARVAHGYPEIAASVQDVRSLMAAPLISKDEVIGILSFASTTGMFSRADLFLAKQVASEIASAVSNSQLHSSLRESEALQSQLARENEALAEIGRVIGSSLEIDRVYRSFAEHVQRLIPVDRIAISKVDVLSGEMLSPFVGGIRVPEYEGDVPVSVSGFIEEEVVRTREAVLFQPAKLAEVEEKFPNELPGYNAGLRSQIAVPLISRNELIGVLELVSRKPNAYDEATLDLARSVADQIAGAIDNATLYEATLRSQEENRRLVENLQESNKELEAFTYAVSHDLRAPLRSIDGFSQALLEDYLERLDADGQDYLNRVRAASQRMGELIDDLLSLSRITRSVMERESVDLSSVAEAVADELRATKPDRQVEFVIRQGLNAKGDARFLRVVLDNLLGNSWKYTEKNPTARIEFDVTEDEGTAVYFVRDDGAGFDMAYADKLFGAFQRLHSVEEFEGLGIGLATVQRIIGRHGGRVWAEAAVDQGATFYFTLH